MEEKTIAHLIQNRAQIRRKIISVCFAFLFSVCFAFLPQVARAATMYLAPSTGGYEVGKNFSVNIYVSSSDQAMNAVSGIVSFPADKLEVVSLSKSGSIISLWVQEPSFSNSSGSFNFEGIVLNPGFIGTSGKIITVSFKAKSAGRATVRFTSGSVLANDGQGTNVLTGLGSADFDLGMVESAPVVAPVKPIVSKLPPLPEVLSSTHSDPDKWYSSSDASFSWKLTGDITGVNVLADQDPDTNIGTRSDGKITEYSYNDLDDGTWYFLIALRNAAGWGDTAKFKFNIDTVNPENLKISEVEGRDAADSKVKFNFFAEDNLSGIEYYTVQLDKENEIALPAGVSAYETIPLEPGKHTLVVKAFDKASNFITASTDFVVESLEAPKFVEYPQFLKVGEVLVLDGKTYANSTVNLWVQKDGAEMMKFTVRSDNDGDFRFIPDDKMKEGVYKIWAEVIKTGDLKSDMSEPITVVAERSAFIRIGALLITFISLLLPIIALILLVILVVWYFWYRFKKFRNRLHKEVSKAENSLHKAFEKLRKNVGRQIYLLEKAGAKRDLTMEEKHLIRQLKKELDAAEKAIAKEIRSIEK